MACHAPGRERFGHQPGGLSSPSALRRALDGSVLLPGDEAYDHARRVVSFNPRTDMRPAIIARCRTSRDVARALGYARSHDLEVAVRGGGHDVLGASVCAGGMLIDLGEMNTISVFPQRRVARVGTGMRVGSVNDALQPYGLAIPLGCNPHVGVAGLTLGGGFGWLLGRWGASCDSLMSVDVVTADGQQVRANAQENAELFWGLRGGGGNLGIATAFDYRLHPVDKVVGSYLVCPGAKAAAFLHLYQEVMARAPDTLTVELVLFASATPPNHSPILVAIACYLGDEDEAQRLLAPFRAVGPLVVDVVRVCPYARLTDPPPELAAVIGREGAAEGPEEATSGTGFNYWQGASLSHWTSAAIETFVACAETAPPGWAMGVGHYLHGAVCRMDDTALPRLQGSTSLFFHMGWRTPAESDQATGWVDQSLSAMRPFTDAATYINYLSTDSVAAVAEAYGERYGRLQALKRTFDRDNVFHRNRNIRPVG